jgi:hypothetical protein
MATKYTPEERINHLSSWKNSGLTQADYCKEHGIKYLTFNKWVYKSRSTTDPIKKIDKPKSQKNFIPIRVTNSPVVSVGMLTKVEIEVPDGTKLRIN